MKKARMSSKKRPDFTISEMPHNRLQAFWDILKLRWDILLYLGLHFLLFAIPLLVATFSENALLASLNPADEGYRITRFRLFALMSGVEGVGILLLAIPFAGALRIYRLLTFYDGVLFRSDFWRGVKENGLQTFAIFFLGAAAFSMSRIAGGYLVHGGSSGFWETVVFFLPAMLSLVFLLPVLGMHFSQIPIYRNTYFQNARNAFYFYLRSFWSTLPFTLLLIAPLFLNLLPYLAVPILVLGIYGLAYLPIAMLGYALHANWVFDRFLNKTDYPEIYDIGIYRETDHPSK